MTSLVIEGEVTQINARLAGVEIDLRDLRKSMDQKLDKVDAKWDARFENLDAKWDARFEKLDAKIDRLDAKIDRLDAKIDRLDAKFESKLEAFSTRRFSLVLTLISATATIAAVVLAALFSGAHGH